MGALRSCDVEVMRCLGIARLSLRLRQGRTKVMGC